MTKRSFGKQAWIEMFLAEFETQWPEDHAKFLAWLGLPEIDVARVRSSSLSKDPQS